MYLPGLSTLQTLSENEGKRYLFVGRRKLTASMLENMCDKDAVICTLMAEAACCS